MQEIVDWTPHLGTPYPAFLQRTNASLNSVAYYSEESLRVLGSIQQLQKFGWTEQADAQRAGTFILSRQLGNVEQTLTGISAELRGVNRSIRESTDELVSTLRWGFASLATSIGRVNDTLKDIRRGVTRPSRTWADEQYEEACYAYDNGWYPEAIDLVGNAINGIPGETGHKLDPRYYYLLGRIRIGSWLGNHPNTNISIVDASQAEEAFLKAARYSLDTMYVFIGEKAEALLFAARAAYLQGDISRALMHASTALTMLKHYSKKLSDEIKAYKHGDWKDAKTFSAQLVSLCVAGAYQHAKYLCAEGVNLAEAEQELYEVFAQRVGYTIEAKVDPDFLSQKSVLEAALARIKSELLETYRAQHEEFAIVYRRVNDFKFEGVSGYGLLRKELLESIDAVHGQAENGGLLDFHSAIAAAQETKEKLPLLFSTYKTRFAKHLERQFTKTDAWNAMEAANSELTRTAALLQQARESRDEVFRRWSASVERVRVVVCCFVLLISGGVAAVGLNFPVHMSLLVMIVAVLLFLVSLGLAVDFVVREIPKLVRAQRARTLAIGAAAQSERTLAACNQAKLRAWEPHMVAIAKLSNIENPFA
jgi:hypothetical protein